MIDKCKDHPTYKAVNRPTAQCNKCWDMYLANNSTKLAKMKPKKKRKK